MQLYDETDMQRFRDEIRLYALAVPYKLGEMSNTELMMVCNGWGPDAWPQWLRRTLSAVAGCYEVVAVPHDVRFEFHIGTAAEADAEFWQNCCKIWRYRWRWRRWLLPSSIKERLALRAVYCALQVGSGYAWEGKE